FADGDGRKGVTSSLVDDEAERVWKIGKALGLKAVESDAAVVARIVGVAPNEAGGSATPM
ncbi:hypothetical protein Dimus_031177, partial [Dionaea muscipula]